jgi:hypothetical protein
MEQLDTNRSDLLDIFEDLFERKFPFGATGDYAIDPAYDTHWKFNVSEGIGILRCVLEDVNTLELEEFEWELNLKNL